MEKTLFAHYKTSLVISAGLILPFTWLFIILFGASEYLPLGDQWDTPMRHMLSLESGDFQLSELLSQHNESRKLIPSSLSLLLFKLNGSWSIKLEMIAAFFVQLLKSFAIANILTKSIELKSLKSNRSLIFCFFWLFSILLFFGRSTYIYQFWSVTIERTIVDLTTIFMLYALMRDTEEKRKSILLSVAPWIAAYTYSSGLAIIPLSILVAFFCYFFQGFSRKGLCIVLTSNVMVTFSFFFGYSTPSNHSSIQDFFNQPISSMFDFIILFWGNFSFFNQDIGMLQARLQGLLILGIILACLYKYVRILSTENWIKKIRKVNEIPHLVVVSCFALLYVFILSAMSCISRLPMDIKNAIRNDYIAHPSFAVIATLGLVLSTLDLKKIVSKYFLQRTILVGLMCNMIVAILVVHDIQLGQIDIFRKISLYDDCSINLKSLEHSQCLTENQENHPFFKEYFTLAKRLKILS